MLPVRRVSDGAKTHKKQYESRIIRVSNGTLARLHVRSTYSSPVVPQRNIVLTPLEPSVHFLGRGNHVGEIPDDGIALALGNADDLGHEARIEEQRVPASDRVCADERVLGGDGITSNRPADRS